MLEPMSSICFCCILLGEPVQPDTIEGVPLHPYRCCAYWLQYSNPARSFRKIFQGHVGKILPALHAL